MTVDVHLFLIIYCVGYFSLLNNKHVILYLHCTDTLAPVTTVQLGEPATFSCPLPDLKESSGKLQWYKQNAGESMKFIVSLQKYAKPEYGPEYSASRITVILEERISNLTILRTVQEDEGMYHCAFNNWYETIWHGTYLLLKGK